MSFRSMSTPQFNKLTSLRKPPHEINAIQLKEQLLQHTQKTGLNPLREAHKLSWGAKLELATLIGSFWGIVFLLGWQVVSAFMA